MAAAAALVTTTSLVSAHGGDPAQVHACVVTSSGQLRVVEAGASCRSGEVALDWALGGGPALSAGSVRGEGDNDAPVAPTGELALGTVGRANLVDGAVDASKLATTFLDALVTDLELTAALDAVVTELELTAALDALLPLTADNIAEDAVGGSELANDAVSGANIANGTVTAADLAGSDEIGAIVAGAVTSIKILDDTIQSRDIADGAVTGSELAADAVTGAKVANGSLSADDVTANAGYTVADGVTSIAVGESVALGHVPLTIPAGVHTVLVTGQGVVECAACTDLGDSVTVQWTLVDGETAAVTHAPTVTLTSTDRMATLPVSFLVENAAAGERAYKLQLSVLAGGTDAITAYGVGLVAVDLGRAPTP